MMAINKQILLAKDNSFLRDQTKADMLVAESLHQLSENSGQNVTTDKEHHAKMRNLQQKRHSEPLSMNLSNLSRQEEQKCFERRRKLTKQESFDLPEEFLDTIDDNVFEENEITKLTHKGQPFYQRSMSMPATLPATLPDVIPEIAQSGTMSPDVLLQNDGVMEEPSVTSSVSNFDANAENVQDEQEKTNTKRNFEGSVQCGASFVTEKRKSVTFEATAQIVRIVSAKGKEARSNYCSSGYGSQSDTSQISQNSNRSSELGSVVSDGNGTFEMEEISEGEDHSFCSTKVDGIVDGKEETKSGEEACESKWANPGKKLENSIEGGCNVCNQEPLDEITQWQMQMSPRFHFDDEENLPNLSIFSSMSIGRDTRSSEERNESSCELPTSVVENTGGEEFVQAAGHLKENSAAVVSETPLQPTGVSPVQRTSPITKEECQSELFRRLFEERMLKYDPNVENVTELLEWFKTTIGEALTPTPKSPFIPRTGSLPSENFKVPQGVIDALQVGDLPRLKDSTQTVNKRLPGPAPLHAVGGQAHPGSQVQLQAYPVLGSPATLHLQPQSSSAGLQPFSAGQLAARQQVKPSQQLQPVPQLHPTCQLTSVTAVKQLRPPVPGMFDQRGLPIRQQPGLLAAHRVTGGLQMAIQPGSGGSCVQSTAKYQIQLPATVNEQISLPRSSFEVSSSVFNTISGGNCTEELIGISQCSDVRCREMACVVGKKNLHNMHEALKRGPGDLGPENLCMLELLCAHIKNCDLPNCCVHWCRYMSLCHNQKTRQELLDLLSCPLFTFLPTRGTFETYIKLDPHSMDDIMPEEWKDWIVLYPLSHSYTVTRAMLVPPRPKTHWVVKMAMLQEGGGQLKVYEKMRGLKHESIAHHLWVAVSLSNKPQPILVVCSEFVPGVSVRELLNQHGCLGPAQTRQYMLQILSALQHLHQLNIIYLNWTCSNLLLDVTCHCVKMSNFITSVDLSSALVDRGAIKLTLPPDIVPTELLVPGGMLTSKSDSWGFACILHEMLEGTRPWHCLRHGRQESIVNKILKEVPPQLTGNLSQYAQLMINQCLQKYPDDRLSVEELKERFHNQWL